MTKRQQLQNLADEIREQLDSIDGILDSSRIGFDEIHEGKIAAAWIYNTLLKYFKHEDKYAAEPKSPRALLNDLRNQLAS